MGGLQFEERLKRYANELGIDAIGITTAEPFVDAGMRLRRMEEMGYLSPWTERDVQKRINPQLLMDDAASLIAVGIAYNRTEDENDVEGYRGRLARFARYQDYHQVLEECMERLVEFMRKEYPELKAQIFVDTGPLVDREVAYRAGLGFIGKNAALIHPELGSFLALGEILVNIPLKADRPVENGCGDCTLCLQACPQQAIIAPSEIHAKQCLAHFTQEKGLLHADVRQKLGMRLWGCDTCQDVCPYNHQDLRRESGTLFRQHRLGAYPDLVQILQISNREYKNLVGETAMAWRGKTTLQRNALINLGNLHNPDVIPMVAEALHDQRPVIRGTAAWALGEIGGTEAQRLLREALKCEREDEVRREIEQALETLDG